MPGHDLVKRPIEWGTPYPASAPHQDSVSIPNTGDERASHAESRGSLCDWS